MRRRAVVGGAIAVGAVSGARKNRAERQAIEQQTDANAQAQEEYADPTQSAPAQDNMTTQLKELKGLLDSGIITQEEFDAKKKQILGI
jgi:predicted Zn-dependent peptidase